MTGEREEETGKKEEEKEEKKELRILGEYHPAHTKTHCLRVVVGSWLLRMSDPAILSAKMHLEGLHDLVLEVMGLCQMEEEEEKGGKGEEVCER